jgi:hypothetical protein
MAIDDTKIVISASDQTKAAFDSVLRGFTDMGAAGSKLTGILTSIGGAIGVGLSVNALVGVVRQVTELEDSLYKMSQRTGVAVEQLSTLRYAADLSGVKLDDLDSLLVKLNKTLGQAAAGDGKAADFLKQFGIASEEVKNGLITTDEALKRISDRFANSPDGINKTTAAVELFGKAGAKMIAFLNTGRDGIEALQTEAKKLGLEIATNTARNAEAMNDQLRTLEFASEGAKIAIVNSMLPAMLGITTAMRDATVEGGKLAGILAGLRTLMTGTDQYKNDVALVAQTEKLLALQKNLDESTNLYGKNSGRVLMIKREIDALNGEIATTMAFRKELELKAKVEAEAAKAREAMKTGGKQIEVKSTGTGTLEKDTEYDRLIASIREKIAVQALEEQSDAKLTDGQKLAAKTMADLRDGKLQITTQQKIAVATGLEELIVIEKRTDLLARLVKADEEYTKANGKMLETMGKAVYELGEQNRQLAASNEEIGLTSDQLGALQIRRAADAAATARQTLETMRNNETSQEELDLMEKRIKLLDDKAALTSTGVMTKRIADEARQTEEKFKAAAENIERALTDALMRGFENGKDAAQNFKETLYNMFRTLVLQPMISAQVQPLAQAANKAIGSYGGGGILGDLGKWFGGGDTVIPMQPGGGYAEGGRPPLGKVSVVGERGPELFIPDSAGTVVPNKMLGAGNSVTVVQHITIDARSDAASIMLAMTRAKEAAKAEILDSMRRGGAFA